MDKQNLYNLDVNDKLLLKKINGLSRRIVNFIYNDCKKNANEYSNFYSLDEIADILDIKKSSIKTTIYNMKKKGIFKEVLVNSGRYSMWRFKLSESVIKCANMGYLSTVNGTSSGQKQPPRRRSNNIYNNLTPNYPWSEIELKRLGSVLRVIDGGIFDEGQLRVLWEKHGETVDAKSLQAFIDCVCEAFMSNPMPAYLEGVKKPAAWIYAKIRDGRIFDIFNAQENRFRLINKQYFDYIEVHEKNMADYFGVWKNDNQQSIEKNLRSKKPSTYEISTSEILEECRKQFIKYFWSHQIVNEIKKQFPSLSMEDVEGILYQYRNREKK